MLTARNFVIVVIAIAIVSVVWASISLMQPPDSGGQGSDSYGTRFHGQRALFEILAALGVPVERALAPPAAVINREVTLVFWKPQADVVQIEPVYLEAVSKWVESGGCVVVAPDRPQVRQRRQTGFLRRREQSDHTVLAELGLAQVSIKSLDLSSTERSSSGDSTQPAGDDPGKIATGPGGMVTDDRFAELRDLVAGRTKPVSTVTVAVAGTGEFSRLTGKVSKIEVPERDLRVLDVGSSEPAGKLTFQDRNGAQQTLAAVYRHGQGELIVVADPAIAENHLIARQDNSVLAAELLAGPGSPSGRPVVFDEFYHGLTIRGNPLWLFTQPGYGVVTLCCLAVVGFWIWRSALFLGPPLDQTLKSRRSIGEYIEAMARFLNRGRSSQAFLLGEVRSGVLHSVRTELRLPPGRDALDDLAAVLARRDPRRAKQLVEAVTRIDEALAQNRNLKEKAAVELFKRISNCL